MCINKRNIVQAIKFIGSVIGWLFNRVVKVFGNLLSLIIRCFYPVKRGRVMCWAYNFKQYSCNPRYLTEYLLEQGADYDIYWVFTKKVDTTGIDKRIHTVRLRSWQYFILVNTAEYLITNSRTDPWRIYWHKRPGQKYLQLWHGGIALKQVEKDAERELGFSYVQKAKRDSRACDLMVSGCRTQTDLLRQKFWYDGEILECGIPRNDIFFRTEQHALMRQQIGQQYGIGTGCHIVLYAPTFRRNHSIAPYRIDWQEVLPHLRAFYGGDEVVILLRLHPNLLNRIDVSSLINCPQVIDVTRHHDMQELLCVSDMLITDYSSSMFDFTMQHRPCLLYATDVEQYDRGYYFDFRDLPYPLARTQQELIHAIDTFDRESYAKELATFFSERIKLTDNGNACASLVKWMENTTKNRP